MATRIVMSKLSPTMEEGRVLRWLKQEGDPVESGDVVLEVETDKATMEVEAMGSGVLKKILVDENATVPTGTVLAVIAGPDEDISELLAQTRAPAAAATAAGPDGSSATSTPAPVETPQAAATAATVITAPAPQHDGGRIKASPLARRMASARGIALNMIQGSGPGGRIIKRDIEAAGAFAAPAAMTVDVGSDMPYERVELSQIRKAIARTLAQSLGPIPHFFLTVEIDVGELLEARAQLNRSLEDTGVKIGVNDILLKVAAQALHEHPDVNVSFAGDHIRRFGRVDVGIAVAVPDGLITPVLRDVAAKGLQQISIESRELIARARDKKLAPEEYQGATFTISNLGMYGIDEFTAVINPPAATILAVGATKERPVVVDGAIEIRSRMRVTLSCDHRAVDGAMGAEFLATLKGMMENPLRLVL